jgi:hypothetical protein
MTLFDEAGDAVTARGQTYGPPRSNFDRIAALLNVWLGQQGKLLRPLDAQDVAMIGVLTKVARLIETPDHRDSVVDIMGYAHTFWECRDVDH